MTCMAKSDLKGLSDVVPKYLQEEEVSEECRELISSLPTEKDICLPRTLHQYQGFWHTTKILQKILTYCQNQFQAQDSDIFLVTLPKSGTTWLKAMVFTLVNRTKYAPNSTQHPLVSNNPHQLFPFLELEPHNGYNRVDSSPRLIATHLPLVSLPESVKKSGCKLVYLCRNPKDNFVSLWHWQTKLRTEEMGIISLEEAFELFCRGVSIYGPVWDHALGYWKESLENPERVLFLKYEELKEDPGNHLRKIAEFIGCPISMEEESFNLVDRILELCSFDHLSNLEVNRTGKLWSGHNNNSYFRRGEVGDWKNHLTPQMEQKLDQISKQKWGDSGLAF